jgi:hypothetical protein
MIRLLLLVSLVPASRALSAAPYETVPAGEDAAVAQIAGMIGEQVSKDKTETGTAHRDAHAKAHGCVRAEFKVEEHLPPELRQGVSSIAAGSAIRTAPGARRTTPPTTRAAWRSSCWAFPARRFPTTKNPPKTS